MRMYAAAVFTNNYMSGQRHHEQLTDNEKALVNNVSYILESFHYISKNKTPQQIRDLGRKIFLDSGAFSAWNKGSEIKLEEYCEFVYYNMDIIYKDGNTFMIAGLDSIGDPLKTYQNLKLMESYGIYTIPCFHLGEDERYLQYYLENYEYISIGGMVGTPAKQLIPWLNRIWGQYLLNSNGEPKVKIHAFGITSFDIMWMYPWYSVDSSTWIQAASFGMIMTAEYGNISVSAKSPSAKNFKQHFCNISKTEQDHLLDILITKKGFDIERLSESYQSRVAYNLAAYTDINNAILKIQNTIDNHHIQQDIFDVR